MVGSTKWAHLEFRAPRFVGGANSINPDIDGSKLAVFPEVEFSTPGYSTVEIEKDRGRTALSDEHVSSAPALIAPADAAQMQRLTSYPWHAVHQEGEVL